MSFNVRIRIAAKLDIAKAEDWYEERAPGLGIQFREAVYASIDKIAANPFLYPELLLGNRRMVMRRFPYNIWFRVSETDVLVVTVIHGKRGPRSLRSKLRGA